MQEKNNILNYIVDKMKTEIPELKTVTRQFKLLEQFRPPELPALIVLDGILTRDEYVQRLIFNFEVILRLLCYDEKHVSEAINNIADKILTALDNDSLLGGNSIKPITLIRIETDEGWFHPLSLMDIRIRTYFTSCRKI